MKLGYHCRRNVVRRAGALAIGVGATWLFDSMALADPLLEKEACADAHVQAQQYRLGGKFKAAREKLLFCSSEKCPRVIRKECGDWIREVDATLPSVTLSAYDPLGNDVSVVRVEVDGELIAEVLDGRAVPLDPGTHTFIVTMENASPIVRSIVIREGEKARSLVFRFQPISARLPRAISPAAATTNRQPRPVATPPTVYALGGVGLVALGSAAYFGLSARAADSDLRAQRCSPNCPKDASAATDRKYIASDLSLGVGLLSLGAAWYLYQWARSPAKSAENRTETMLLDVQPMSGAAGAVVSGAL